MVDMQTAEQVAFAVRTGQVEEVRRLLTQYPQFVPFLDLPETVTGTEIYGWTDYAERHGQRELLSLLRSEFRDPIYPAIYDAIRFGDVRELRQLFNEHPRYVYGVQSGINSWLKDAADYAQIEVAEMLVAMGADVNSRLPFGATPLRAAIRSGKPEMVEWMLSHGAAVDSEDRGDDRLLISAIDTEPEEVALRIVDLLTQRGADVNRAYTIFDDENNTYTALEWAAGKPKVAQYLRSKGAVERKRKPAAKEPPANLTEEIIAYFEKHFGLPQPQAQIEIVPTEPPIAIHVIPATDNRKSVTLFTTGMSKEPMRVPTETDNFRFAELFIQLPANWPTDHKALSNGQSSWPIHWLRSIAKYPHQNQTWLGGPVTIIANGDRPEPLGPGLNFTSLLVMADREFTSRDGRKVYLYRLTPLYTEERELEIKQGIGALLRAFDENDVPSIVDLGRPSVAKGFQ